MLIKNDIIILTTGEYSDYSIQGLFKVKKDFDIELTIKDLHKKFPKSEEAIIYSLLKDKYIEEIEMQIWNFCSDFSIY